MRLLHVVDVLALAGMEYNVIKLVNRLDPNQFSPIICCQRGQLRRRVLIGQNNGQLTDDRRE